MTSEIPIAEPSEPCPGPLVERFVLGELGIVKTVFTCPVDGTSKTVEGRRLAIPPFCVPSRCPRRKALR